jgi:citrate synthase
MYTLHEETKEITDIILAARDKAREEVGKSEPEAQFAKPMTWPVQCTVGPGLEGAIACESKVGYVNGSKGMLVYRGYDIFDLCAYSTFEEVSYLLVHGELPNTSQLREFNCSLARFRSLPMTLRRLGGFPVENINTMAALRIGTMMMRQRLSFRDSQSARPDPNTAISADEDSIPMETKPMGEPHAIYEFKKKQLERPKDARETQDESESVQSCMHLISGMATIAAGVARMREEKMPIEPDTELSHAANLLYMMTGRKPTPIEERVMDVALILHADHGMNASTFASMVVASTLSDIYFSVGAGIAALNGPLHGGANEQVLRLLQEIGPAAKVSSWFEQATREKRRIMGFGHRVYKAYDPRARILGPLAKFLIQEKKEMRPLYNTARELEKKVVTTLGAEKKIFPNVDFYSGIVYAAMGIEPELFTPIFAVSRVSGWCARILEYLDNNRIFRPRAMYIGEFDKEYVPIGKRGAKKNARKK